MNNNKVAKKILNNGLTVLVLPNSNIPKVSVQLWYNVGSKDEQSGQKGIAHLLEHMIFKGTKKLSESDINMITNKLSGYCNAFTSYDYTGYMFDFPTQHWHEALPMLADCMQNCTMKEELLNSELKAVIQELKMYKDNYSSTIVDDLICAMFPGHPYQHPIIGYKHDLWNLNRKELLNFYQTHYVPNNATLVVTGDVTPEDVFDKAEKNFGSIDPNTNYKKAENNIVEDICSKSVSIYRDVQQPLITVAFKIPGTSEKLDFLIDIICWVIASGKSSRLYKKLVQEQKLVTDIDAFSYDLFEKGLLFVSFYPNDISKADEILQIIGSEFEDLAKNGPTEKELARASKQVEMEKLSMLESCQKQAYAIGQFYLANGDENYIFNYFDHEDLSEKIKALCKRYLRSNLMNVGKVLPMNDDDKDHWQDVQKISDLEDSRVLSGKQRDSEVEPGVLVNSIQVQPAKKFEFPKYKTFTLDNGLEVLYHHNPHLPKIDMLLELKSTHYYDPESKYGLSNLVGQLMVEGTENYSAEELADFIESNGMSLYSSSGGISMRLLKDDFKKGLSVLGEVVSKATMPSAQLERVKLKVKSDIKNYWDSPSSFISQIASEVIYEGHPFHKNVFGTTESLDSISQDDVFNFYKKHVSPNGAKIAIVGDLSGVDIESVLKSELGSWQGDKVPEIEFPKIKISSKKIVEYNINRDQTALAFAAPSISRKDPNFDNLLLFDQILCGGSSGSMSSKLFQLRERSGLFYTIGGSLLFASGEQPGMAFVKTIVSNDRLEEAEKQIESELINSANKINEDEFDQAKSVIISSLVDNFKSNMNTANSFLFLRRHNFDLDFFDNRAGQISNVNLEDVKNSALELLKADSWIKFRVGRIQK